MDGVGSRIDGVAADLLAASRSEKLERVITELAARALDGYAAYLGVVDRARRVLVTRSALGHLAQVVQAEFSLDVALPGTHVARTGASLVVGSAEEYAALFPDYWSEVGRHTRTRAFVYVPIVVHHELGGVLGVSFERERRATPDDLAVLSAVARFAGRNLG